MNAVQVIVGSPLQGIWLEKHSTFLQRCALRYDPCIEYTVLITEQDNIIACGSLDGHTVKCVAVHPDHQGEDLTARVMTALLQESSRRGIDQLMLYTKPHNQYLFTALGFHPVMRTSDCLLMENKRNGLASYLDSLQRPNSDRTPVGSIVAHCNPFTRGHRYLIETAARECAFVHVFVLSEDKGLFSPEERLAMVREGCRDLKNVLVHPTDAYMVSSATFPTYFVKNPAQADSIFCELDIRLFGQKIAPALGITRRYVGTEPHSIVTAHYNQELHRLLPAMGVEVIEKERITLDGSAISASRVRALLQSGQTQELSSLLPDSTLRILSK